MASTAISPDQNAAGLTDRPVDAIRYDCQSRHKDEVAGIIRSMMPAGVRVLDVGCGTGSVTLIANEDKSNHVLRIEPDVDRAAVARSKGLDVQVGMLDEDLQQCVGLFDVVMSSDVLEHTPSPGDFLQGLMSATKPGGLLILSVPNVAHWSVRQMILMGRFDYDDVGIMDATHLRWFTARSLRSLFEHYGLKVCELRQTAGVALPCYGRGLPHLVPGPVRRPIIRVAARVLPLLFGAQHVIKAKMPN